MLLLEKGKIDFNDEKKQQIFTAAEKEFALYGYEKASTNNIIKAAGVSKGLLFHYFGSKKNLYWVTLDASLQHFLTYFDENLKDMSEDILERLIEINIVKMKLSAEYPLRQKLLTEAILNPPKEMEEEILKLQSEMVKKYMPLITSGINYDKFKKGIDKNTAINFVMMMVDALGDRYIKAYRESATDYQQLIKSFVEELKIYADMVKYGIYKAK